MFNYCKSKIYLINTLYELEKPQYGGHDYISVHIGLTQLCLTLGAREVTHLCY